MEGLLNDMEMAAIKEIELASDIRQLEELRIKYLGRKGQLKGVLGRIAGFEPEIRSRVGAIANKLKDKIELTLRSKAQLLNDIRFKEELEHEKIDVTLPGKKVKIGGRHPAMVALDEIKEIFFGMGFSMASGPDIEWDVYNFDKLNMPKDHPAREESDTFFITNDLALRTQTSSVQIRYMETHPLPIRIISPGRVYRVDEIDATHSPMFHQIEGLVVDKGINMGHLKYTLEEFAKRFYGEDIKTRFRPHHFQFTEPSAEMDICCFVCEGAGCRVCKQEGFVELLGAGVVHPHVLEMCDINPNEYSGFAFGIGLDRVAMWRYAIDNLKLFFENDVRFLKQFS